MSIQGAERSPEGRRRSAWDSTRWGSRRRCRRRAIPTSSDGWRPATPPGWTTCTGRNRPDRIPRRCSRASARWSWSASSMVPDAVGRRVGDAADHRQGGAICPGRGLSSGALGQAGLARHWLRLECPEARGRAVADTAPLLERDYARLAGLGWIGKNTMLINRRLGSFTFLGALLTDLELAYDAPHAGQSLRDVHAMPRGLPDRCVRRPLPSSTRGDASATGPSSTAARSPITRPASSTAGSSAATSARTSARGTARRPRDGARSWTERPEWVDPDLLGWLTDDRDDWRARLKGTAPSRAKRTGLVRNAALVLGSRRVAEAVGAPRGTARRPAGGPGRPGRGRLVARTHRRRGRDRGPRPPPRRPGPGRSRGRPDGRASRLRASANAGPPATDAESGAGPDRCDAGRDG